MKLEIEQNVSTSASAPVSFDSKERFRQFLNDGVKAAQSGDRKNARRLLMSAIEIDPQSENAWLWLASISEYPEELLVFLNNVLDINPSNERALQWSASTKTLLSKTLVQRGVDAHQEGRTQFAVQCFDQALAYDDRNENAWLWFASLADTERQKIDYLRRVLAINPENQSALSELAEIKGRTLTRRLSAAAKALVEGDETEALSLLAKITSEWPECEEAWVMRAQLATDLHNKLAFWGHVLEVNPGHTLAAAEVKSLKRIQELAQTAENDGDTWDEAAEQEMHPKSEPGGYFVTTHIEPDAPALTTFEPVETATISSTDDQPGETEVREFPSAISTDAFTADSADDDHYYVEEPAAKYLEANYNNGFEPRPETSSDPFESYAETSSDQHTTFEPADETETEKEFDGRKSVMVVDDSATVRKLISQKLEGCGYRVICVEDGRDVVDIAKRSNPALVLLDIAMPKMNGYQVCRALRENEATAGIPVVLISGKDGYYKEDEGAASGASGFITKPFGPETLMKTIEHYLADVSVA